MKNLLTRTILYTVPILLFFGTLIALGSLVGTQPFGHDESVYLTKARSWIENTPADQFAVQRPIGMVVFGWILLQFSRSEQFVRLFGVAFGAVTILLIYLFFKRISNFWVALSVSVVVASSTLFLREASQFFNDVPSSALLIAILLITYQYHASIGKGKYIYLIPFVTALVFYLRYGVVITLGVVGIVTAVLLLPRFRRNKEADYSKLTKTVGISFLLFLPHFIQSYLLMKDPVGILSLGEKIAGRKYFGEGLITYIHWLPYEIGGWIFGITAIVGIIATILILLRRDFISNFIGLLWAGCIGILSFIAIGLFVHAEPRYVFFPMVLLSGVGISALYFLINRLFKITANLLTAALLILALYSGVGHYKIVDNFFRERERNETSLAFVDALKVIKGDSLNDNGCALWLISFRPTASWYSRCNILVVGDVESFERDIRMQSGKNLYSLVFTKLTQPQITRDVSDRYGVALTEIYRKNKTAYGDLIIYKIVKVSDESEWLNW